MKIEFLFDPTSIAYINNLSDKMEEGLSKALIKAMLYAEGQAKGIFKEGGPVLKSPGPLVARTGHLRRSIRSGVDKDVGWIGTNVLYGRVHELGLGKMPERPFLGPSFEGRNLDKISDILLDSIVEEMTDE